ncbi:MAG: class I SAM-dependent methyltransferase [Xanthomonadales bacterium]|nr:class I SAM-dependent methyltransferase [Xanthomonadales bacterium]
MKKSRLTQAESTDRHLLYQSSVQDVESELDFVIQAWGELRSRRAELLREDFCGTANTACEWVRRGLHHQAIGVDLDGEVLQWGRQHNIAKLSAEQQQRIVLREHNVLDVMEEKADIILAMNFSYYLFLTREQLRDYFSSALLGLHSDGLLVMDAYGGYEAPMELQEPRECEGFTYIWDQARFNPIDSLMDCHIHFEFSDGSRLEKAFSYHWRLWTLPEIKEILLEAGFSKVSIYWEGTDEDNPEEGNGIYAAATQGDADPGWIAYIVAEA